MSWPYGDPPEPLVKPSSMPTWQCPGDKCECHAVVEGGDEIELPIVLLAHDGARMPGARCRVHEDGRILNEDNPNADGDGRIKVKVPRRPTTLFVEWAPESTPLEPGYPYRARYYSDLGSEPRQVGRRRLANLGFWTEHTLEDNVRTFQRRYGHKVINGKLEDIEAQLTLFHDTGCPPVTHDDPDPAPSLGKGDLGNDSTFGLAPGAQKAKAAPEKGADPPPPTAQTPVSPAPNQGSIKIPSPGVQVDLLIDWGHGKEGVSGQTSTSFWLHPATVPVAVGVSDAAPPRWAADGVTPVTVTTQTKTSALATLPVGPIRIRVDFDLKATLDGKTRTVLAFSQLFFLFADGNLMPDRFAFADYTYARGAPPTRAKGKGTNVIAGNFREGVGLHPLLSTATDLTPPPTSKPGAPKKGAVPRLTKRLFVNAEMVDTTDLWWDLHNKSEADRYLNPALLGRTEHLRVLAWTRGKLPMIWFAVIPDAALMGTEGKGADLVFFRPPPGANSFTHKPDADAFKNERHHLSKGGKVSTLWMLARFLLPQQTVTALTAAGITDRSLVDSFADQVEPSIARDAAGTIHPAGPAPHVSGFTESFRACAFERSLDAAGAPNILFFPLASENDGYPGAVQAGLKRVVETAVLCLWNHCALALDLPTSQITPELDGPTPPRPQSPSVKARKLWLAGHSAGNLSLASALGSNGADVDRALTFGATHSAGAIDSVVGGLTAAAAARKLVKKTIDAFVMTAPDMTSVWVPPPPYKGVPTIRGVSMDVALAGKFIRSGAAITFLPAFDQQLTHFTIRPATSMTPVLRNLVGVWNNTEVDAAAGNPHSWQFLFFHEYPVHGGTGTVAAPNPFFLQALGTPSPLTTAPKTLPP